MLKLYVFLFDNIKKVSTPPNIIQRDISDYILLIGNSDLISINKLVGKIRVNFQLSGSVSLEILAIVSD